MKRDAASALYRTRIPQLCMLDVLDRFHDRLVPHPKFSLEIVSGLRVAYEVIGNEQHGNSQKMLRVFRTR